MNSDVLRVLEVVGINLIMEEDCEVLWVLKWIKGCMLVILSLFFELCYYELFGFDDIVVKLCFIVLYVFVYKLKGKICYD